MPNRNMSRGKWVVACFALVVIAIIVIAVCKAGEPAASARYLDSRIDGDDRVMR